MTKESAETPITSSHYVKKTASVSLEVLVTPAPYEL